VNTLPLPPSDEAVDIIAPQNRDAAVLPPGPRTDKLCSSLAFPCL